FRPEQAVTRWSKAPLGASPAKDWFRSVRRLALDQAPAVATQILETRDDAIGLMPWLPDAHQPARAVGWPGACRHTSRNACSVVSISAGEMCRWVTKRSCIGPPGA